ncbi:hypothetical protein K432DRAFT_349410 [Lepidopterella palustris CBS 459.81]|uniref:CHAT domain-containing protein n=1 Tax=Lepidopterella palustris CBS 459.81 TaxID=1314670 RepID=A0A8E2EDY9_9PEZI|nr:hypothetical protein K432DRAFT_349410 [Lepidopterella palustris CBS 459.81]
MTKQRKNSVEDYPLQQPRFLEEAVKKAEECLFMPPQRHDIQVSLLHNSAIILHTKYMSKGRLEDLQEAIKRVDAALQIHKNPSSTNYETLLCMWGTLLGSRYQSLGDPKDLHNAIGKVSEAILTTSIDHIQRALSLNTLSNLFRIRYMRFWAMEDIDAAIAKARDAAFTTDSRAPVRFAALNSLSIALCSRYERTGRTEDLDESILRAEQVLSGTPESMHKGTFIGNLGNRFAIRFRNAGSIEDLEMAISRYNEAMSVTPDDHPDRARILGNLGIALREKFQVTRSYEDLQKALETLRAAISVTPLIHPERASRLVDLGACLHDQKKYIDPAQAENDSLGIFMDAFNLESAQPIVRIKAARSAITVILSRSDWEAAYPILERAISLFPLASVRFLNRKDQEHIITELNGLAALACSIALQTGKSASKSLELLELSRGVILGLSIDCRSDLSDLMAVNPGLCQKFEHLREMVNSVGHDTEEYLQSNISLQKRIDVFSQLDETTNQIRKITGFERFQLPQSEPELMALAQAGPVVLFNSTPIRSDAIIVTSSQIEFVNLPELLFKDVESWSDFMIKELGHVSESESVERQQKMRLLLSWLWRVAVEPVVRHLQLTPHQPIESMTRIWWIGVSLMGSFPFHAAGTHSRRPPPEGILDYAISSYTPTLKMLSFAWNKKTTFLKSPTIKLYVAAMPETPGENALPGVTQEANEIANLAIDRVATTCKNNPGTSDVLKGFKEYDVVHVACHGMSTVDSPSESYLMLSSAPNSPSDTFSVRNLTAQTIASVRTTRCQLAYLSACRTAENRALHLADEVLHIASGFQLAGISHVVGTMWKSKDKICVEVAKDFYSWLFRQECAGNDRDIAEALHRAIVAARTKWPKGPISWAPFIHLGP